MKYRIKTKRPTSTINQDDDILSINIPYESTNKELRIVTSTKDKLRNHTESLKDAKIFLEPRIVSHINSIYIQLQTGLIEDFTDYFQDPKTSFYIQEN